MPIADWGSRSPYTEGPHEDFITKNSENKASNQARQKQLRKIQNRRQGDPPGNNREEETMD